MTHGSEHLTRTYFLSYTHTEMNLTRHWRRTTKVWVSS